MGLHIDSPSHWQCIQEAYKIEELERNDAQMVHQTFSNFTMIADMPRIHWNVSLLHAIPQFSRPRSTGRLASCGLASRVVSRLSDYQAMLFKVKIGLLINVELNRVDSLQTNIYIYIISLHTRSSPQSAKYWSVEALWKQTRGSHPLFWCPWDAEAGGGIITVTTWPFGSPSWAVPENSWKTWAFSQMCRNCRTGK